MCGFAAVVGVQGAVPDAALVERMTAVIRHRGPDDEGTLVRGPVALGFRRLSILDMSPLGHQPMVSEDGQVALVFNGEIYNYVELRSELQALGHRFRSSGDTEVLLHAYLEWGRDCVRRFNGMWAFVIHDLRTGTLFGSRDRFGIKPLFRWNGAGYVLFASEIKSIRASGLYTSAIDWQTSARYLLEGRLDDSPRTFYAGIGQVPPATAFELDSDGSHREWSYWSLAESHGRRIEDPAGEFAELFEDAVRLHMRSDVPVGVHLSGGLDSTSILCSAARLRSAEQATGPLMAFAYMDAGFDESAYVADTIEQTRATLVRLQTDPQRLWSLLREVLTAQDEPVYSMMPLVVYELMRLTAANGIRVVLNGQGADETLAGYPNYFRDYWSSLIGAGRLGFAWHEIGDHARMHGGARLPRLAGAVRHRLQSDLASIATYRRLALWRRRRRNLSNRWYTENLARFLPETADRAPPDLETALADSVYRTPLPQILRIEDRNAMAHSVESRVPFLDHRLVSFAFSLPPEWHLRGPWNKYVLREAMRGRIAESVRTRVEKMGFPVSSRAWLAGVLYEPIADLLHGRAVRERGIYRVEALLSDLERHRRGDIDASQRLFDVAQFETWTGL